MSVELTYLLRKDEAGVSLRDLDDVVLLVDATTDAGAVLPNGTEGTIVGVWGDRDAFEVEFSDPPGALATVSAGCLRRVGRQVS